MTLFTDAGLSRFRLFLVIDRIASGKVTPLNRDSLWLKTLTKGLFLERDNALFLILTVMFKV